MEYRELLTVALDFAAAILLGALVGIEREKRKSEEEDTHHIAGLRTFILLALFGAAAAFLSRSLSAPWIFAVSLLIVGAFVAAGYYVTSRTSQNGKGLTTEIAAVIVFLLGAMVMYGYEPLAIGLTVVTAAVLAYKQPLHGFVEKLGWDDVYAGMRLLIATFIALPLLPNEPVDPWGALNPYKLWLLVILISSLSLVGYVLTRLLGASRGRCFDRACGRPCLIHGCHLVLRQRRPRDTTECQCARLRHSARLGRDVRARAGPGGGGQPPTSCASAGPVPRHGGHCRRLRRVLLLS